MAKYEAISLSSVNSSMGIPRFAASSASLFAALQEVTRTRWFNGGTPCSGTWRVYFSENPIQLDENRGCPLWLRKPPSVVPYLRKVRKSKNWLKTGALCQPPWLRKPPNVRFSDWWCTSKPAICCWLIPRKFLVNLRAWLLWFHQK